MEINCGKSHILFDDNTIVSENKNEVLGIFWTQNVSFGDIINKLNALAKLALQKCLEKRKTVTKVLVTSWFGYCLTVLMYQCKSLNDKIYIVPTNERLE